jgi:endonuclease III
VLYLGASRLQIKALKCFQLEAPLYPHTIMKGSLYTRKSKEILNISEIVEEEAKQESKG